jgi:3-hydroxyisobutyrate dehydrogenase
LRQQWFDAARSMMAPMRMIRVSASIWAPKSREECLQIAVEFSCLQVALPLQESDTSRPVIRQAMLRAGRRVGLRTPRILFATNSLHAYADLLKKRYRACFRLMWKLKSKSVMGQRRCRMKPITPENSKLGFVGIGYMGRPIARRLLESGFKLTAYDRNRSKAEELLQYGGTVAESVAALSASCNVVLSCLPNDETVLDTYRGSDGVFANAHGGSLVIDLSTVSPETSLELSRLGSEHGVQVLDVTMSGSTPTAEKGLLTLFGGGDPTYFDAAEPIFRVIARRYFYLGRSGSGATMKLVVNALLGIGMQAIAEAVALGEKAGLDRNRLLGVLSETAVVAPAHVGKLERAMKSDYSPQFPIRLMNKDFGLILNLAAAVGARMPAVEAALEINARQLEQGHEQDFSAVILQMEKQDQSSPTDDGELKSAFL